MIISIIALINSFCVTPAITQNAIKDPAKLHASPRKIILLNYKRQPKSREILKKKITKPWDGHFSAQNFHKNEHDNLYLKEIKENLRTSIIALPKWHTKALKYLEIKNKQNISRGLSSSSKIILNTNSIKNSQELIAVFIHEMGHITDLGALKGKNGQKTRFYDGQTPILSDDPSLIFYQISWENSSTQKKSAQRSDFVSGYSTSDCFEDFAETYLFYKLHGDKFRGILNKSSALKKKYQFMKKYVFNNQEFQLKQSSYQKFQNNNIFDATLLTFDPNSL